jgi:tetratricopeptide (TPR) repeat protein
VFAESFDLDAAEAVCGFGEIEAAEVAVLLGSLVDKSLVQSEPAGGAVRYRLLETIREFAVERLTGAGDGEAQALAAAHGEHFLRVAEAAAPHLTGPDQGSWLARLDADQPNLRRAAEHAAGRPDGTAWVLRFGVALFRCWAARSRDAEALALLGPALRRPGARADPRLFPAALVAATFVAHSIDNETARQLGEQAVALARQLGDDRLLVESLTAHGATCYLAGQPETAVPLGQEAVERARQLDDDVLLGGSLMVLLMSCYRLDPARSGPLFTEAIACTGRSGDQFITYHLHNNAGVHALYTGDIPAARAHLEAAVRAIRAIGEKGHPVLLVSLGWVLRQESDQTAARSTFEAALRISRRTGQRMGIAYASLGLACLAAELGDWHRAAVLHGVAHAWMDRIGEPWPEPEARYRPDSLGQVRSHLGDDQLEPAYAQGMALSPDDAVDLALGRAGLSS